MELGLDAPDALDENGSIPIPADGTLLNIRIPEQIGEVPLRSIGPGAFKGTTCLRSVTIPASITEIGADAFADCPGLTYIVLEGRTDAEGLTLGENWNGEAQVIFGLLLSEKTVSEEPAVEETTTEEPAAEETQQPLPEPVAESETAMPAEPAPASETDTASEEA